MCAGELRCLLSVADGSFFGLSIVLPRGQRERVQSSALVKSLRRMFPPDSALQDTARLYSSLLKSNDDAEIE